MLDAYYQLINKYKNLIKINFDYIKVAMFIVGSCTGN